MDTDTRSRDRSSDVMTALVAGGDGSLRPAEVPRPVPSEGSALVRVHAASLNRGELRVVAASSGVPGWDAAGVLAHDVPERGLARGARVAGFADGGTWAELAAVPVDRLAAIPEGVSFEEAAALPIAGLTALHALRHGGLLLGRRVLVTGAAGGVGRLAVQLAHRAGAHVTALARDDRRAEGLRALGADAVASAIERVEEPFELVLESVGGSVLERAIELLAPGGDLVSFGSSSGERGSFDPRALFNRSPGARIHGYQVFEAAADPSRDLALLLGLVRDGRLDPQVERIVAFDEAAAALADLAARRINGKCVLRVAEAG